MTFLLLLLTAAGPPTARPVRRADQLDFVLLAAGRPVTIRIHARSGHRSYAASWDQWADKFLAWYDRDGDGALSSAEAARILPADLLVSLCLGSIRGGQPAAVPFSSLDRDKDGKVSRAELVAYLRRNGLGPTSISADPARAGSAQKANKAFWAHLDTDGDGKLSQAEFARLPSLLGKLDEDEDEQIAEGELTLEGPRFDGFVMSASPGKAPSFLLDLSGPALAALPQTLLRKYDRDKDRKLTQAEIGLESQAFKALDSNGDGKLDARELEMLAYRPADLTFRGRVGAMNGTLGLLDSVGLGDLLGTTPTRLTLLYPGDSPLARRTSRLSKESMRLKLMRTTAYVAVNPAPGGSSFPGAKAFYLRQFTTALPPRAKGLTREQANGSMFVVTLFAAADRDGDGTLTHTELADFLSLIGEMSRHTLAVQAEDFGQGLFGVIDANGNGQLSMREMRTAWQRVKPLCKDGKALAREDLPRRVRISLAQGLAGERRFSPEPTPGTPAVRGAGRPSPTWFKKMDKNGDGDISVKEWLGSLEDFKRLDKDGDGLISAAEALASDPTKK